MQRHYIDYMLKTPEVEELVCRMKQLSEQNKLHTSILCSKLHIIIPELSFIDLDNSTLVFGEDDRTLTYRITESGCVLI